MSLVIIILALMVAMLGREKLKEFLVGHHAHFEPNYSAGASNGECGDPRIGGQVRYRVLGGPGAFSFGLVWLLGAWALSSTLLGFAFLFVGATQFFWSCFDLLVFYGQVRDDPVPPKVSWLLPHTWRKLACGRTSAWCPLGLPLLMWQQRASNPTPIALLRAVVQFILYDIWGFVLSIFFVTAVIAVTKRTVIFPSPL